MESKLSKYDWELHVCENLGLDFSETECQTWWFNRSGESYRLVKKGYETFCKANVKFYDFLCELPTREWNGTFIKGLTLIPTPFYLINVRNTQYHFYIVGEEFATLFIFMDKDITTFARTYYLNENI